MVMDQPTFYFFDDSFGLEKRVDARKATWNGKNWIVQDGLIQESGKEGTLISRQFKKMELELPEKPETFLRPIKQPEEMGYRQLKRVAEKINTEGYDATRYLVDMNIKLAFPLISLIMVLVGVPIALGINKGGTPLAVSLGIVVCFLYLINFGFARSLGLSGVLPPLFSAWLANAVFFFLGVYMMMRLKS
jgi:lipopolysaccharide export system permease protein